MSNFYQRVYDAVSKIPSGKVATYGQIAALAGSPRASRIVGTALHHNKHPKIIPCHRVVNRFGTLAEDFVFGGKDIQKQWLCDEGVEVSEDYKIDLPKYIWDGRQEEK